jgi:hypothetical protein
MSNRGFISAGPHAKSKILAESASFIPLFWLSFLSTEDMDNADEDGTYELDRNGTIERSSSSLPFLSALFPQIPVFDEAANSLLGVIKSNKSKSISIDVQNFLSEADDDESHPSPRLRDAVEAIENRNANYSLTIPARMVENPFTREKVQFPEQRFASTADMLVFVCSILAHTLNSKEREVLRDAVVGHVWD